MTNNSNLSNIYFIAVNEQEEKIPLNVLIPAGTKNKDFYDKLFNNCISMIPKGPIITCICTDGEPSISSVRNQFCEKKSIMSIRCCVHLMNLLLKDFFKFQNEGSLYFVFISSLKLVSYFHKSPKFYEDIKKVNIDCKRIKTLSDTRFIFFIDVLESIMKLEYELRFFVDKFQCEWDIEIIEIIKNKKY